MSQAGLHQLCWSVCAENNDLPSFIPVCSAPHCLAIYVSLKPNYPPQINIPEESYTRFGVIAYHQLWKFFTDLWITDDSGYNDVELHLTCDTGYPFPFAFLPLSVYPCVSLPATPHSLYFLQLKSTPTDN